MRGLSSNEAIVNAVRPLVSGDGLVLEPIRFEPMSGLLTMRLTETDAVCTACVMDKSLLEHLALPAVKRVEARVQRVEIEDCRK